jgi:hypothetical protein
MAFAVGPAMVKDASVRENTIYNALVGGIVLVGLIACVFYYPSRPPKPPSISAGAFRAANILLACARGVCPVEAASFRCMLFTESLAIGSPIHRQLVCLPNPRAATH